MKIGDMTYWQFMTHGWKEALLIVGVVMFIVFALPLIVHAIKRKLYRLRNDCRQKILSLFRLMV